jgi:hypothetical protein
MSINFDDQKVKENIEVLYDFITDLKKLLGEKLPEIQDEVFEPLMDFYDKFPDCSFSVYVYDIENRFMKIEKQILEIWGVSQFFGPELDTKVLNIVTDENELHEMAKIITGNYGETETLVEQVNTLNTEMIELLNNFKNLLNEEEKN